MPNLREEMVGRPLLVMSGAALALAACTQNAPTNASGSIAVTNTDTGCQIAAADAPSGSVVFTVTNQGSEVTEFYLLAEDQQRIVGEVENIGPGITRDLVVLAEPGTYYTSCRTSDTAEQTPTVFTVTDSGQSVTPTGPVGEQLSRATNQYAEYVKDQSAQLLKDTKTFAAAYVAGDDDAARSLYASTRTHWERIEPVAESFGDLDPKLDLREADLEEGQIWTGWHRIEKDLWPPAKGYRPLTDAQRQELADRLVADTEDLNDRVQDLAYSPDQLSNGAKELLDEVATGKVTGEEEIWSHTDLWDFQANVDGARIAFEYLEPVVKQKNPELAATLSTRFEDLQAQLDTYRSGDGFVLYTELTPQQIKQLAAGVDALSEPLSQLTSTVIQ